MVGLDFLGVGEYAQAQQLFDEMNRLRLAWAHMQPVGLRRSEMGVLGAVAHLTDERCGAVTIGSLAREMKQSMSGVSQKVSELERQGYLRRVANPKDRRVVTVELTVQGRRVAENSLREFLTRIERVLSQLGEEKNEELFSLMRGLSGALEQEAAIEKVKGGSAS